MAVFWLIPPPTWFKREKERNIAKYHTKEARAARKGMEFGLFY